MRVWTQMGIKIGNMKLVVDQSIDGMLASEAIGSDYILAIS